MVKRHGIRSSSNWRYRVIKKYKHRAQKFVLESKTNEQRIAWLKVVKWFDDILEVRFMTPNDAIGIPMVEDEEAVYHG